MNLSFKILLIYLSTGIIYFSPIKNNFFKKNDITYSTKNKTTLDDKKCSFCHSDKIKFEYLHSASEDNGCENCHQSTGEKHPRSNIKGFELADKTPALCNNCHEPKSDKQFVHSQISKSVCISCHSPHGAKYDALLIKASPTDICKTCHKFTIAQTDVVHAPFEINTCQDCHDSHQSDERNLLVMPKSELCFSCHDDIKNFTSKKNQHPPFEEDCSNCHKPHNSKYENLLTENAQNLCFTCHDQIQTNIKTNKNIHSPLTDKKNCSNCHSPHASDNSKMLVDNERNLCLSCHNKEISISNGKISNIKEKLETNKYIHSVILSENCAVCHNPHTSENQNLLKNKFPADEYVTANADNFALCFDCHDSNLLTATKTTDATNFRDGNQNLHFLHINGDKGRNCNFCHDSHAGTNKFLIKQKFMFGNWETPMKFKITTNGGSCSNGCHFEKNYDRINAVFKYEDKSELIIENNNISDISKTEIINNSDTNNIVNNTQTTNKDTISENHNAIENPKDSISVTQNNITEQNDIIENKDTISTIENNLININVISAKEDFNKLGSTTIYFDFAKSEILEKYYIEIKKIADFIKAHPVETIVIQGYTDDIGDYYFNLNLAKERAKNVRKALFNLGILPERIKLEIYGEQNPLFPNDTEEGKAGNRRVEFKLN